MKKGFTLVELLIVIALIAILSVAVLATINPIEQTNKARDARVQNDAAEVMNAYERYYASLNRYPWMEFTGGAAGAPLETAAVTLRSDDYGFGICSNEPDQARLLAHVYTSTCAATCVSGAYTNVLIQTSELKSSFAGKDMFEPVRSAPVARAAQALWTVKAEDSNSIYVCYIPKASANRVDTTKLRCINEASGVVDGVGVDNCTATVDDWATPVLDGTSAMFKCVPE